MGLAKIKWQDVAGKDVLLSRKDGEQITLKNAVAYCYTPVAEYLIRREAGKFVVNYGGRTENSYDTLEAAKNWAENQHYRDKMQPWLDPDSVTDIVNWFKAAKPEPTTNDLMTQVGCHLEEFCELLDATGDLGEMQDLQRLADWYKNKNFGDDKPTQRDNIEILDALCDQIVTAIGVGYMMGFDMHGALAEVIRSNNSKMIDGKFEFDENGKIKKPKSFSEPNLKPFAGVKHGKA